VYGDEYGGFGDIRGISPFIKTVCPKGTKGQKDFIKQV